MYGNVKNAQRTTTVQTRQPKLRINDVHFLGSYSTTAEATVATESSEEAQTGTGVLQDDGSSHRISSNQSANQRPTKQEGIHPSNL